MVAACLVTKGKQQAIGYCEPEKSSFVSFLPETGFTGGHIGIATCYVKSLQIFNSPQSSAVTGSGLQIDDDVIARVLKSSRAPSRISNWLPASTRRGDYLEASPPCKRKS